MLLRDRPLGTRTSDSRPYPSKTSPPSSHWAQRIPNHVSIRREPFAVPCPRQKLVVAVMQQVATTASHAGYDIRRAPAVPQITELVGIGRFIIKLLGAVQPADVGVLPGPDPAPFRPFRAALRIIPV